MHNFEQQMFNYSAQLAQEHPSVPQPMITPCQNPGSVIQCTFNQFSLVTRCISAEFYSIFFFQKVAIEHADKRNTSQVKPRERNILQS